jgi:hypothetical protein
VPFIVLNPTFTKVPSLLLIQNPTLQNKKVENNTYLLLIQNNAFSHIEHASLIHNIHFRLNYNKLTIREDWILASIPNNNYSYHISSVVVDPNNKSSQIYQKTYLPSIVPSSKATSHISYIIIHWPPLNKNWIKLRWNSPHNHLSSKPIYQTESKWYHISFKIENWDEIHLTAIYQNNEWLY